MASPSSARFSGAPAEPPPVTRAWLVTPDAASVGPKKKCLTLLSANHISRLVLHVRKVDLATRRMRVVAQVPHGLDSKLEAYISLIARECVAWAIEEVTPTDKECAIFSGRQVLRTPHELSGDPNSSGVAGDELSVVSSSTSATGTIRAEQERVRAEAERDAAYAALEAERAASAAALAAERAKNAASTEALAAERAKNAASTEALAAERANNAAERAKNAALVEELRRLQTK